MPSFDVVSQLAHHEVDNALQQAQREIAQRFDFKDTETELEKTKDGIVLKSNSENRVEAALQVLREKMTKRSVSLKSLDPQKIEQSGMTVRQLIKLKEGIPSEKAKELNKFIKDNKYKVQSAIQGDTLRVTGKKKDDLQEVIAALRSKDFDIPLQFINFRD